MIRFWQNLILAGSDTTMVTLIWALSLLLKNPRVLQKAQCELDMHVGNDRRVEESDITNLVYLQAIVKETLRLYPPGPIIFRAAMEDCTLSTGYHVPAVAKPSNLEDVDMTESIGLTNLKARPLEILVSPRLEFKLYDMDTEFV
ncbi:Cytochrome P450 - like 10 [Theobroma cacao]|nr:Cytochrome P450 - like 10 [Theobroma cacao]